MLLIPEEMNELLLCLDEYARPFITRLKTLVNAGPQFEFTVQDNSTVITWVPTADQDLETYLLKKSAERHTAYPNGVSINGETGKETEHVYSVFVPI